MLRVRLEADEGRFRDLIKALAGKHPFRTEMIEKDYYLTKLLTALKELYGPKLVFKGGTCLNKVYLGYYRMSEDLDFINVTPGPLLTRKARSKAIDFLRKDIGEICKGTNLDCKDPRGVGANLSTQYFFNFEYQSLITNAPASVTLEITQRNNPILKPVKKTIKHIFQDPFTGKDLFFAGEAFCLNFGELVAEKVRATITREEINGRDVFDLGYLYNAKFDFLSPEFKRILKRKLKEDSYSDSLRKYRNNFGRNDEEIDRLKGRIEEELYPMLSPEIAKKFNLEETLGLFNSLFSRM